MSHAEIDFETYSEAGYTYRDGKWRSIVTPARPGIEVVGAAVYAEHPSCRVLCLAYDLHDGYGGRLWRPGCPPPTDLFEHIQRGGIVEAWNVSFERHIWRCVCAPRMGWPELPLDQCRDAMVNARAFGLPGRLALAGAALEIPDQKDKDGARLLKKFSVPPAALPEADPVDGTRLYRYCLRDIKAEEQISQRCPELSPEELRVWQVDQIINERGVAVDAHGLHQCQAVVAAGLEASGWELSRLTQGAVCGVTQVIQLRKWLGERGVQLPDLQEATVTAALEGQLPPAARRVLEIRAEAGGAAVKKLSAMSRMLCRDGRLHDMHQYYGAATGRWAGRGVQVHNFPRDSADDVDALLRSLTSIADASRCLRGLLVAGPGMDLICSDYSAIEAVVLTMLSGEQWRIDVFRGHGMIYEMSASRITGTPFADFEAYKARGESHPLRKTVGKIAELASGYQGSVGAWKRFGAEKHIGSDEAILEAVRAWRRESPMVVALWAGLERTAIQAVQCPGQRAEYRLISYQVRGDVLFCRLPSGREIAYQSPRLSPAEKWGKAVTELSYTYCESARSSWVRGPTYGGHLTENVCQAVARDILAAALVRLDEHGYRPVMHIHDEIVGEVPEGWGSVEEFEALMSTMPDWARDWPVRAAGGWRGKRYRKG